MRIAAAVLVFAAFATAKDSPFTEKYRTGIRWMRERQWQRADAAFAEALAYRESPDARRMSRTCRFNLYLESGAGFLAHRSYESAVEQYQRALDLDSQSTAAIEGLRTAEYQAALGDAMRALAAHNEERARRSFERCLEIRTQDEVVRGQLRSLDAAAQRASDWRKSWAQLDGCLAALDADCLDRQIPLLMDVHAPEPLLPALLSYQRGDLAGAESAARDVGGPSAIRLRSIVRAQVRRRFAKRWGGWSAGLYGATLLLGLFFGVRGVRTRQLHAD